MELLGHMVTLYLTFWGPARQFSKMMALFVFPVAGYEAPIFYILSKLVIIVVIILAILVNLK